MNASVESSYLFGRQLSDDRVALFTPEVAAGPDDFGQDAFLFCKWKKGLDELLNLAVFNDCSADPVERTDFRIICYCCYYLRNS